MGEAILKELNAAATDEDRAWLVLKFSLDKQADDVREAVWAAAVPHWFDQNFLNALLDVGTFTAFSALVSLPFVEQFEERGFNVHGRTRRILLDKLATEDGDKFAALSQRAADYAYAQHQVREDIYWYVEYIYHLLIVDKREGENRLLSLSRSTRVSLDESPIFKDVIARGFDDEQAYDELSLVLESVPMFREKQFRDACKLLGDALKETPDSLRIKRGMAAALGAKAEYAMETADRLGIIPIPGLVDVDLLRAIEVDPTLPDPYWDMAVIKARFDRDYAESQRYLDKAKSLGYYHSRMDQLERIIETGLKGEKLPPGGNPGFSKGEVSLRTISWHLAHWPEFPYPGVNVMEIEEVFVTGDIIFNSHCVEAATLVRNKELGAQELRRTRRDVQNIFQGDVLEYVLDLIRIVAYELGDDDEKRSAVEDHVRILVDMSRSARMRAQEGTIWLRRARRAARRGMANLENSQLEIDPDLHAELVLAYAQTYTHPSDPDFRVALGFFLQGLEYKEQAKNLADVEELMKLIGRIVDYIVEISPGVWLRGDDTDIAKFIEGLEVALAAAKRIGRPDLQWKTASVLVGGYELSGQESSAARLKQELLQEPWLSDEQRGIIEQLVPR